jgi:hypothetical protein
MMKPNTLEKRRKWAKAFSLAPYPLTYSLAFSVSLAGILIAVLLGVVSLAEAQDETKTPVKGLIPFDFPNAPEAKVEVNLSSKLIGLVAKGAKSESEFAELIRMLTGVYVRIYAAAAVDVERMTGHYIGKLEKEKWELVAKVKEGNETIQVGMLLDENTVYGVFVVVASSTETILVNIVGQIAPERMSDLLGNLEKLGLPALKDLKDGG